MNLWTIALFSSAILLIGAMFLGAMWWIATGIRKRKPFLLLAVAMVAGGLTWYLELRGFVLIAPLYLAGTASLLAAIVILVRGPSESPRACMEFVPAAHSTEPQSSCRRLPLPTLSALTLLAVRRIMKVVVLIVVVLVAFAVAGDNLPEGNPVREATAWLRYFGRKFADGFGGGYQPGP